MPLKAHDEHGLQLGSEVTAVAGYIGDKRNWERLTPRWNYARKEFGIQGPFHASKYWRNEPLFDQWTDAKKKRCLRTVIKIARDNTWFAVGGMVGTKDWYEIMAPRYKCSYAGKLSLRHPYHFCIQMLFVRFLRPYYERLRAAAKSGKVAVLAAMRKLLVAEWSVATHRRPFVSIRPTPKVVNHA